MDKPKTESKGKAIGTTLDQTFKTIIHDSNVLSWIIRENVDELSGKNIEEIKKCLDIGEDGRTVIGRETEYASSESGSIVADSVFDVRVPGTGESVSVIVNVEAEHDPRPKGYPLGKRAEYYMARMVSAQKGKEFTGSDYGNMRKVYGIWCILGPKVRDRNTVIRYGMEPRVITGEPNDIM